MSKFKIGLNTQNILDMDNVTQLEYLFVCFLVTSRLCKFRARGQVIILSLKISIYDDDSLSFI